MNPLPATSRTHLEDVLKTVARRFPYPVAASANKALTDLPADPYGEWAYLVRYVFHDMLHYLAHLILAELAGGEFRPPHLFHRILDVCGNAGEGQLVGFIREGSIFLNQCDATLAIPELAELASGKTADRAPDNDSPVATMSRLVQFRNAIAHTDLPDKVIKDGAQEVRELICYLLQQINWIVNYPLRLDDGSSLMGSTLPLSASSKSGLLGVIAGDGLVLRPLVVRLNNKKLALLQRFDPHPPRFAYRSAEGYHPFGQKELKTETISAIYREIQTLLDKVRALEAPLNRYAWDTFSERTRIHTERTVSEYTGSGNGRYRPHQYVERPEWEGSSGIWSRFISSDRSLLAISSEQGGGKSSLAAHLAECSLADGHAVFFIDAFRLNYVQNPRLSENPLPEYFASLLHYTHDLDHKAVRTILRAAPPGKSVVLIIDSINEVTAFTSRWNRFRVIECLIDWACELAHPGFKMLLTFRLSEFTKYGYLDDSSLPTPFRQIVFTPEDTSNWVHTLEPMNVDRGQMLFNKLVETKDPLAPCFSWEYLEEKLGSRLPELAENPLLFRVFLQVHAGQRKLTTTNRDELFVRYAESLCGVASRRSLPWWRKAWLFLIDGNITKTEQFLSDMAACMAKTGNPYVSTDQIEQLKDRPARRIFNELHSPHSSVIAELISGGLLLEDHIEHTDPDRKNITIHRLSLVAETLTQTLRSIHSKILARSSFKYSLRVSIGFCLGILALATIAFWFHFYLIERYLGPVRVVASQKAPEQMAEIDFFVQHTRELIQTLHAAAWQLISFLLALAVGLMFFMWKRDRNRYDHEMSIESSAAYHQMELETGAGFFKCLPVLTLLGAIIPLIFYVFASNRHLVPSSMFLVAAGLVLLMLPFHPILYKLFVSTSSHKAPVLVLINSIKDHVMSTKAQKRSSIHLPRALAWVVVVSGAAWWMTGSIPEPSPQPVSLDQWASIWPIIDRWPPATGYRWKVIGGVSGILICFFYLFIALASYIEPWHKKLKLQALRERLIPAVAVRRLIMCIFAVTAFLTLAAYWLSDPLHRISTRGKETTHCFSLQSLHSRSLYLTLKEEPDLSALHVMEESLPAYALLDLQLTSPPKLDWFDSRFVNNPLRLHHPPDANTRLDQVQKLIVPAETDLQLLQGAEHLRWIHFEGVTKERVTREWLDQLDQLVQKHLLQLETLEMSTYPAFSIDPASDKPTLHRIPGSSAVGRAHVLEKLRLLGDDPQSLFP